MQENKGMFFCVAFLVVAAAVPLDRGDDDAAIRNVIKKVGDENVKDGASNKNNHHLLTLFWTEDTSIRSHGDSNRLTNNSLHKVFKKSERIFKRQVYKTLKITNDDKAKLIADERFEKLKEAKEWIWKHHKVQTTEAKDQVVKHFLLKKLALSHSRLLYQTSPSASYKSSWKNIKHRKQQTPQKINANANVKIAEELNVERLECHYLEHFHRRWVLMIANCPRSFSNETLRAQCEHRPRDNGGNVVDVGTVPVQLNSGLVYRNLFCAICNGVKSIEAWDVNVVCNGVTPIYFVDGSAKITLLRGASDGYKCQKTLVPKSNDKLQLCVMTKRRSYKHFAMDNDLGSQPSETIAYPVSFSILMNFGFDGKTHILFSTTHEELSTSEQPGRCSQNEVYNPDYDQCQHVVCPPGYVLSGKSCNPDSNFSAKPPTPQELETLNSVDELHRPALITLLVNVSHNEVKDLMDPVFQKFLMVSLCDLLNITCERITKFKMKPLTPNVTSTTDESPYVKESSTNLFEYLSSTDNQGTTVEFSESVVSKTVSTVASQTHDSDSRPTSAVFSTIISTPGLAPETYSHDGYTSSSTVSEEVSTPDLDSGKHESDGRSTSPIVYTTISTPDFTSDKNDYNDHPTSPFVFEKESTPSIASKTNHYNYRPTPDLGFETHHSDGLPAPFSTALPRDTSTSSDRVNAFSGQTLTSMSTAEYKGSSTKDSTLPETTLPTNQIHSSSDVASTILTTVHSDHKKKYINPKRQVVVVEMSFVLLPPINDVGHGDGKVTNVMQRIEKVIEHKFTLLVNGTGLQVINMDNGNDEVKMDAFCSRGITQVYFDQEFDVIVSDDDGKVVYVKKTQTNYYPGMYDLTILFTGNVQKTPNVMGKGRYVFVCVMPRIANSSCGRLNFTQDDYNLLPNKSIVIFNRLYAITEYEVIGNKSGNIEICVPEEFYDHGDRAPNMLVVHGCDKGYEHFLKAEGYLTAILGRISIIALTTVLLTYVMMKKLRNLPGVNTMNLTFSLLSAEVIFILGEDTRLPWLCSLVAVALHYFFLASFFWMNVMTYDVFKTFANRCILTRVRSKSKFMWRYSLYAWGSPLIIVGICAFVDFTGIMKAFQIGYGGLEMNLIDPLDKSLTINHTHGHANDLSDALNSTSSHKKTKEVKASGCWIQNPVATLIVFGGPMLVIFIVNGFLFIRTILCIQQTAKMVHINTRRSSISQKTGRYDVMLYVRMSTVMGFTWVFGLASSIVSGSNAPPTKTICYTVHTLSILFTVFNCSQGLFIFFAFVVKRRIFNMYKDLSKVVVQEFKKWKENRKSSFYRPSSSNCSSTCSSTTTISHVS